MIDQLRQVCIRSQVSLEPCARPTDTRSSVAAARTPSPHSAGKRERPCGSGEPIHCHPHMSEAPPGIRRGGASLVDSLGPVEGRSTWARDRKGPPFQERWSPWKDVHSLSFEGLATRIGVVSDRARSPLERITRRRLDSIQPRPVGVWRTLVAVSARFEFFLRLLAFLKCTAPIRAGLRRL